MTDLALTQTALDQFDFALDGYNGLAYATDEIQSYVILSLFTDSGWWGDSYNQYPLGSKLSTLYNSKITSQVQLLKTATDYCNEALLWMTQTNLIQSYSVSCQMLSNNALGISVTIVEFGSSVPTKYTYSIPGIR